LFLLVFHEAIQVLQALLVQQELQERPALQDHKATKVTKAIQAQLALQEPPVPQALKVLKETLAILVHKAQQVLQVHKDPQEQPVQLALPVLVLLPEELPDSI